ncbi:MAG: hypothetical protein WKF61_00640 [Luteimonas sp.]
MNKHATMRLAKTDPLQMTPLEKHYDQLQKFENFSRYCQQSANTRDGAPGQLPVRQPLTQIQQTGK